MFGRIHQWLAAVVVVGILKVATAWADAGYLPQAGPLPFRFRIPPPPVAEHLNAPPAPPPPAPIALPTPPMPSAPPETTIATPARMVKPVAVAVTNGPALEFEAREPLTGPAPDGVISPQMLMQYFTPSSKTATNAASLGVVAPIGFTPPPVTAPAPPPPPSGKPKSSASP